MPWRNYQEVNIVPITVVVIAAVAVIKLEWPCFSFVTTNIQLT